MTTTNLRLGKWPYAHNDSVLRMTKYLASDDDSTLNLPDILDLTVHVKQAFPMDDNDKYGNCTCAAAAHMVQVWTGIVENELVPTNVDVDTMYFEITKGSDNGAVEADVLTYWQQSKGLYGWKPATFVACDPTDPRHIKAAASLFGGVYIGLQLPVSAHDQLQRGEVWDVTTGPGSGVGSWGGHAVNVVGYDALGVTVVTWGQLQKMTWNFWAAYCDEAWAVLPNDWEQQPGIDWTKLMADTALVAKK